MNLNKWNNFSFTTRGSNIQNSTISTSLFTFNDTILTLYPKDYYVLFIYLVIYYLILVLKVKYKKLSIFIFL